MNGSWDTRGFYLSQTTHRKGIWGKVSFLGGNFVSSPLDLEGNPGGGMSCAPFAGHVSGGVGGMQKVGDVSQLKVCPALKRHGKQ